MNTPPRFFAAPPPSSEGKAALRARLRAQRRDLARVSPGAAFTAALAYTPEPASIVAAVYHPLGAEMDSRPVASRLREAGARIALPVAVALDAPLVFRLPVEGSGLVRDAAGVPAPGAGAPEITPDLVIVPLLAFDATGARLGQGGGYYDRSLAALRARGRVVALGLAYAGQEVARLPAEPHDQRLDAVLTECGLRVFAPIWPP